MFQPSSVVRLVNGTETPALLMSALSMTALWISYLTSQIRIMECTPLIYLTKPIPAEAFTNIRGLFCMWNFTDFCHTRLTMGLRLEVSDASAVEPSQKL